MLYKDYKTPIPLERRDELNRKVIYLIDSGQAEKSGITREDVYNVYTGIGGLHGLKREDFANYHEYSEHKKKFENGQFFTPSQICELVMTCLRPGEHDLVADLTCGMGSFFNYAPVTANVYGCELDVNAWKVAHFLYPEANLEQCDIRSYKPEIRFDYVVGNPPFNLRWWIGEGNEMTSQLYYCYKAAELMKPLGIMALVVPQSFLADDFLDKTQIRGMEQRFRFLGQLNLSDNAFSALGVREMPTKLQFWQRRSEEDGTSEWRYTTDGLEPVPSEFDIDKTAQRIYDSILMLPKADLEKNKSRVMLELARTYSASQGFAYETQKLLYQIKAHPATRNQYARCCEYLHRFFTQKMPEGMDYKEWDKVKLTEAKVLVYLRRALQKQNKKPERDLIALVKRDDSFVYKAYSAKMRRKLTGDMQTPVPVYRAVLDNEPEKFPGFERLLRRKHREYEVQSQPFSEMSEDPQIGQWLRDFKLWDAENEEYIYLNDIQRHDINLMLQKRYGMLQWEQGSGKTLAAIAMGLYRMEKQGSLPL